MSGQVLMCSAEGEHLFPYLKLTFDIYLKLLLVKIISNLIVKEGKLQKSVCLEPDRVVCFISSIHNHYTNGTNCLGMYFLTYYSSYPS